MRSTRTLLSSCLAACLLTPALAASDLNSSGIEILPNPVLKGQTVTLHWLFTGSKVVLSGGRFGKGTVVTGKTAMTDAPRATTRYRFDTWYRGMGNNPKTGAREMMPLHSVKEVVVEVIDATMPPTTTYRDPHGWQIGYVRSWQRDSVPLPDAANNGLFFFQPEDDSVERIAVSILPAKEMTADDVMKQVEADLPSHYNEVTTVSRDATTYAGAQAVKAVFSGIDLSHPGVRTQSIVVAAVRDGRAYIVSARTAAARFRARQPILDRLVGTFTFTGKSASASR